MILNGFNDRGSLTQLLMRRLNMTGNAPVPVLMPELGANLVLESDRPEWGWAKEEFHFAGGLIINAVAAERGILWLPQLTTQDYVITITEITATFTAASVVHVIGRTSQPAISGAPTITNPSHVDDRATDTMAWAWVSGTNPATPAATRNYCAVGVGANTPVTIEGPWIITRRTGLCVYSNATNARLDVNVRGYYRRAQPGELV